MISEKPDLHFLKSYFQSLERHDIDFCVIRNVEEVIRGDAHDIDMCVGSSHLSTAEKLLSEQAQKQGWKLHLKTGSANDLSNIKCYNYHFIEEEENQIYIVHIDIFPTYAWKGYELLSNETLLENVNKDTIFHSIAPETESVCNLFVRLLYNGAIKDKYKPKVQGTFRNNKEKVCELMRHFLSEDLVTLAYDCAIDGNWKHLENARPQIIRYIKKNTKRNLLRYISYLCSKALHRKGIIVAFMGTDGSGKSTIINGIERTLANTFSNNTLNYYHWRPGYIKSEKRLDTTGNVVSNVQPHSLLPYGTAVSLLKILLYTGDYILGYWMKIYWQAAQGHLVVFDRYYYDFYMDKARYRLKLPDSLIRIFHPFIPKPDITFVLLGNADQIQSRKNELPLDEVRKQIYLLQKHKQDFSNTVEIDVCQHIPEVVYNVSNAILEHLTLKNNEF